MSDIAKVLQNKSDESRGRSDLDHSRVSVLMMRDVWADESQYCPHQQTRIEMS